MKWDAEEKFEYGNRKKEPKKVWRLVKGVFIFGISFALFLLGILVIWGATVKIPDASDFGRKILAESTKIYDRTGKILLHNASGDIRRTLVPIDEIPVHAQNATLAIEDARFYEHRGIDPKSTFRAIFVNIGSLEYGQGGSTITQQVAKMTFLTPEKTLTRKLKEWMLALKIESALTKKEILELYFNEVPYGGNVYGIEEAARMFFGKKSAELDIAESAYLASIPNAPSYYSPYGNHKDALEERKNIVLRRMLELGSITQEEYRAARERNVEFLPPQDRGTKAPHLVMMVRQYLEEKYGKDAVENGGLKVITTIDYELQEKVEKILAKYGAENVVKFKANNAATVGLDPRTGQILILAGSRDFYNPDIDGQFNVAISPNRQPGSSFKPFVYATAFMKGYTPDTVVFDLPTEFNSSCLPGGVPKNADMNPSECYSPENYDHAFRGPMKLRDALAQSVNIAAVKVFYLAGIQDSIETAKKMGITTLKDWRRYGLTLVLGSGEVSLLEMTNAYAIFANEGVLHPSLFVFKVEDAGGNILEEWKPKSEEVIPAEIARKVSNVLSDNAARAPAFGASSFLSFPDREVAVKTGTTNDYRDAWIIGYTPSFTLGTWVGNNDNKPMDKQVAGFIVAPMWNAIMREVLNITPTEYFTRPEPVSQELSPAMRGFWNPTGNPNDIHTILWWIDKENPLGSQPSNPGNDPQFFNWEASVRAWVTEQSTLGGQNLMGGLPIALSTSTGATSTSAQGTSSFPNIPNIFKTGAAGEVVQ